MDTKFTPGPWTKSPRGSSGLMGKLPDGTEFLVCSVGGTMFGGLLDDELQNKRNQWARQADEANAALIAAAPELYAALAAILQACIYIDDHDCENCRSCGMSGCHGKEIEHTKRCWYIKGNKALAKARGEMTAQQILEREG